MGISTWVAGRFFLKTMTQPGTLTVQVAHTQEAARGDLPHGAAVLRSLPEELREGALKTSRANARPLVFPELDSEYRVETAGDPNAGRGLTVQNLHCSEVARWPRRCGGDAGGVAGGDAGARWRGGAGVDAEGGVWMFLRGVDAARRRTGVVRHFFPWWWERAIVASAVERMRSRRRNAALVGGAWIDARSRSRFGGGCSGSLARLARQEYPERCGRVLPGERAIACSMWRRSTGGCGKLPCCRWSGAGTGALEVWLPPVPGASIGGGGSGGRRE